MGGKKTNYGCGEVGKDGDSRNSAALAKLEAEIGHRTEGVTRRATEFGDRSKLGKSGLG